MFIHTSHVFSRHPEKRASPKSIHVRDISITSTTSTSSTMSFASTALSSNFSASNSPTSPELTASPTSTVRPGLSSSPPSSHPKESFAPDFNPLSLHPTFGPPPPRLSERPILQRPPPRPPAPPYPVITAPTPVATNFEWRAHLTDMLEKDIPNFPADYSPRHTIHTSTPASTVGVATDYFMFKMPTPVRPELKSHWSASTIGSPYDDKDDDEDEQDGDHDDDEGDSNQLQTIQDPTPGLTPSQTPTPPVTAIPDEALGEVEAKDRVEEHDGEYERFAKETQRGKEEPWPFTRQKAMTMPSMRNDSYKRSTVAIPTTSSPVTFTSSSSPSSPPLPRRPRMKTIDSVENFVKRGGWKRRGIVFQQNEARAAVAALAGD